MPLIVSCPEGCWLRMPTSRAGKIVRCPQCKSRIRVATLTNQQQDASELAPLEVSAALVDSPRVEPESKPELKSDSPSTKVESPTDEASVGDPPVAPTPVEVIESQLESPGEPTEPALVNLDFAPEDSPDAQTPSDALSFQSAIVRDDEEALKFDQALYVDGPGETPPQLEASVAAEVDDGVSDDDSEIFSLGIDLQDGPRNVSPGKPIQIQQRASRARDDRIVLARFFAICLCGIALINMVPAFNFWQNWREYSGGFAGRSQDAPLPRWIYLQIFIAAIHVMYAVFLVQINDWSSLRAVSIAMLVVAMAFGMVSTGILIGGYDGAVANFLELRGLALVRQASIWCVAMLCLSTLMSYLGGRESARWQRAEILLNEIGSAQPASGSSGNESNVDAQVGSA